jgi:hypothetical protein
VTTRNLPVRSIGCIAPIFAGANGNRFEPAVRDFTQHDMNVTIRLNLLGWQVATFKVDLDMGRSGDDIPKRRPLDGACKRLSRRWVNAMMS